MLSPPIKVNSPSPALRSAPEVSYDGRKWNGPLGLHISTKICAGGSSSGGLELVKSLTVRSGRQRLQGAGCIPVSYQTETVR